MTSKLNNISEKIDPSTLTLIVAVDEVLEGMNVSYFLIGARARDIVLTWLCDLPPVRTTTDHDVAVSVSDWADYEDIIHNLLHTGCFRRDAKSLNRLLHVTDGTIDLVPFGAIAGPGHEIRWPPDLTKVLKTFGFQEAYRTAIPVRVRNNPPLDVKVCTPAALAVLKLFAWVDRRDESNKDAEDLYLIMRNYLDLLDKDFLDKENVDTGIEANEDFDYELAGARILGRHVSRITDPDTHSRLVSILREEVHDDSYRLAVDTIKTLSPLGIQDGVLEKAKSLLQNFLKGLQEVPR